MRRVSEKRAVLLKERKALREDLIGSPCERCGNLGTDWHEIQSRARGGSIVDPENRAWLCRPCHKFITENPLWALRHGWSVSQFLPDLDLAEALRLAFHCPTVCLEDHREAN